MSGDQTTELQQVIIRLRQGDDTARRELINRAYPRLHRLVAKILGESFPRLKEQPALQNTSDVANEVSMRLYQALEEIQPASVLDFFRLAACRTRWLLLDLAKKPGLPVAKDVVPDDRAGPGRPGGLDSDSAPEPAAWSRLHEQIGRLGEEEQAVVDLLFYHGLSEADAADLLGVSGKTVHRRWRGAQLKLFNALQTMPRLEE
jgi:RNA polymerase sigma-70 factor (ECF subfamily)